MEPLDERFGEGSTEDLNRLFTGSGLECLVSSRWSYDDERTVMPGDDKPDEVHKLDVMIDWWADGEIVANAFLIFLDEEPKVCYWSRLEITSAYQSSGLFEWIWTQWPIKWATPRDIDTIKVVAHGDARSLFRHCGLIDDQDAKRIPDLDDLDYLKGGWGSDDRMGQYIAWKTGRGDKPSYLDDPAA